MNTLKKHKRLITFSIVLVLLDIFHREFFFIIFLLYGLMIKFILSESMSEKLENILKILIWILFFIVTFLLYYSNHNFVRGPMIDTGDVVCQNDDRGSCAEKYIEDIRNLKIPEWAKFFKGSGGELLWIGLLFAGIIISTKKNKDT